MTALHYMEPLIWTVSRSSKGFKDLIIVWQGLILQYQHLCCMIDLLLTVCVAE